MKTTEKFRTRLFWVMLTLFFGAGELSAETLKRVENQSVQAPQTLYRNYVCGSCHGERGLNPLPGVPLLGGQDKMYLINRMKDYKNGARTGGRAETMVGYLAVTTNEEIAAIADWLSAQ